MGGGLLIECRMRLRTRASDAEDSSDYWRDGGSLMEHVVFSAAEGGAGEEFRRVGSREEAVRVVEHLRNDLGVTDASVFALTPVPLAYRAYYHVEVPGGDDSGDAGGAAPPTLEALLDPEPDSADIGTVSIAPIPTLLPRASAVPPSRADGEAEHSLGYFAR
jgi:hypothetical protein